MVRLGFCDGRILFRTVTVIMIIVVTMVKMTFDDVGSEKGVVEVMNDEMLVVILMLLVMAMVILEVIMMAMMAMAQR